MFYSVLMTRFRFKLGFEIEKCEALDWCKLLTRCQVSHLDGGEKREASILMKGLREVLRVVTCTVHVLWRSRRGRLRRKRTWYR